MNNTLQDLHNSVDDGSCCGYILFGRWRCNSNSTSCSLSTGSPSLKYEHWRTLALLHNIRNMRICMAKNPFIFIGYRNDVFLPYKSLYFKCYTTMPNVHQSSYFELGLPVLKVEAEVKIIFW